MATASKSQSSRSEKAHVKDAAADLLNESRKLADEYYAEGVNKVNQAEEQVREYTDSLLQKVQENPLKAVLIAGGIGFLLSKILK